MARFHVGAVAITVASCGWVAGFKDVKPWNDAPGTGTDGNGDGGGSVCFGSNYVTVCFDSAPTGSATYPSTGSAIGTSNCTISPPPTYTPMAPPLCIIAGGDVTLDTSTVSGSNALVVVATNSITVNGIVDASAHSSGGGSGTSGPGSPSSLCGSAGNTGSNGGGAGGSYVGLGGSGGASTGAGGTAAAAIAVGFHAGCRGQSGNGNNSGHGGNGGGAVYLISHTITINGSGGILVNGAGGGGGGADDGCTDCGAGGGGTGGTIVLEGANVTIANGAQLCSVGGGGGQGAGTQQGQNGHDPMLCVAGSGGDTVSANVGGSGGNGGDVGSNGVAGTAGTSGSGGGGGGGGVGAIRIFAATKSIGASASVVPASP